MKFYNPQTAIKICLKKTRFALCAKKVSQEEGLTKDHKEKSTVFKARNINSKKKEDGRGLVYILYNLFVSKISPVIN